MNPYIIGPYSESDTGIFWGRTKEIEGLYRSFLLHDYLVCYANSGEGKSSILNAGLCPKLRDNKYFPISIRFRFGENDVDNFDRIINAAIDLALSECDRYDSFETSSLIYDTDDEDDRSWQKELIYNHVWLRLRYSELKIKNENGEIVNYTPVLIFDQFEEVFTNPESELWTKSFFHWLEELSTDVCPHVLLDELHNRIDEESFPIIKSLKRFKAIFSLRSEYVGNIDYWGLQHYYIPDLKNNRYFLKPLTPDGAKEVIMQPNGIDITSEECDELICGCSENSDYVRENMPCVPASVLSIICHELYEHTEQQRTVILKSLHNDRSLAIDNILENYYLKLLKKCGINDDKTRDAFEKALVDDKGNRKRIGTRHKDFSLITQEQIKKLKENNLLRVISNASDEQGEIIELPHDKFCGFIMNHKNKRFEEIKTRNNSLKEWLLFGVLGMILGATAWYFHHVFIDTLKPLISDFLKFYSKEDGGNNLFSFISYISQNIGRYEIFAIICIIQSVILLPCSILCFAKQWKKAAIGLSFCGSLISMWLVFRVESVIDGDIGSFSLLSLLLSLGITLYTIVKWNNIKKTEVSSWPIWGSWFAFFSYLFWEFLRSLKIGASNPVDSWYFVILLPMLLLAWTYTYFKIVFYKCQYKEMIQIVIIGGLLGALAINNMLEYSNEFKFGISTICIMLIAVFGAIIYFMWNITSIYKRIIAITINVFVLFAVYILNIGYNPLKINYNNVESVYSWRMVYVKDSTKNLLGICDPLNGDTIMPCVMSYDNEIKRWKLKSLKFENNPILNGNITNIDSSFTWKNGVSEGFLKYSPTLEEHIRKINNNKDTTLTSQIDYYSTKLYKDIRSACLEYIVYAKPYSIEDIKSLRILDSLQNNALAEELKVWNTDIKDTTIESRDRIDVIEDEDIHRLLSIITQNMYLYVLKDRILQKDFPSIFTLANYHNILYHSSVPFITGTYNFKNNISININDSISEYSIGSSVCGDDVIDERCFAWYNLFITLCYMDNSYNVQLFVDRFQKQLDLKKEYVDKLSNITDNLENLNKLSRNILKELEQTNNVELGVKSLLELYNERETIKDEIESLSDFRLTENMRKTIDEDIAFNKFSKEVLDTLFKILENKICNIYNDVFKNICMHLISTRSIRGYNVEEDHNRLVKINAIHDGYYNSIMNVNIERSKTSSELSELIEKINEMLSEM